MLCPSSSQAGSSALRLIKTCVYHILLFLFLCPSIKNKLNLFLLLLFFFCLHSNSWLSNKERKRHKDIFCDADLKRRKNQSELCTSCFTSLFSFCLSLSVPENNLTAEWLIGIAFNLFDDTDTHISFSLPAERHL